PTPEPPALSLRDALPIWSRLELGGARHFGDARAGECPPDHLRRALRQAHEGELRAQLFPCHRQPVHAPARPCEDGRATLPAGRSDRKSTRLNSSHVKISY